MTKKVLFFSNGTTAVLDEHGQPMPAMQRSWLNVFATFLEDHDEDPEEFEFILPDGRTAKLLDTGWTVVT